MIQMYEVKPLRGLSGVYLGERLVGAFAEGQALLLRDVLNSERMRVVKYFYGTRETAGGSAEDKEAVESTESTPAETDGTSIRGPEGKIGTEAPLQFYKTLPQGGVR